MNKNNANIHIAAMAIRDKRKIIYAGLQKEAGEYIDVQRKVLLDNIFGDIFKIVEDTKIAYRFELEDPQSLTVINLIFYYRDPIFYYRDPKSFVRSTTRPHEDPPIVTVRIKDGGIWSTSKESGKEILNGDRDELILLLDDTFYGFEGRGYTP